MLKEQNLMYSSTTYLPTGIFPTESSVFIDLFLI
jgi:hypothetical protein